MAIAFVVGQVLLDIEKPWNFVEVLLNLEHLVIECQMKKEPMPVVPHRRPSYLPESQLVQIQMTFGLMMAELRHCLLVRKNHTNSVLQVRHLNLLMAQTLVLAVHHKQMLEVLLTEILMKLEEVRPCCIQCSREMDFETL